MLKLRWPSWGWLSKVLVALLAAVAIVIFYVWRLGSLTPGLSPEEATARFSTKNFDLVWHNPIFLPQRLAQYGLQAAGHHGAFWMRLPSIIFALVLVGLFYFIAKFWFGRMVALLAAIMLASTPWVVLLARNATPDILLLAPIALWLSYDWLRRAKPKELRLAWAAVVVAAALSFYVPGVIWLIIAGGILAHNRLRQLPAAVGRNYFFIVIGLGFILILPLLIAMVSDISVLKSIVLWPAHWPTPLVFVKSVVWSILALFWRTPYHISIIIGRLPILDVTQIVLIIFGTFALWTKARKELYALAGLIALGVIGASLDQKLILITFAVPSLALLVAAGLRYLYVEWRGVFPNNPIPKTLAIVFMALLVSLHVILGARYSLVAWPHTAATRQTYMIK